MTLSRNVVLIAALCAGVVGAAFGYQRVLVERSAITGTIEQAPERHPPELLRSDAADLLEHYAVMNAPAVRVALGDVVTVDAEGRDVGPYPDLAAAGAVEFRLCRFPGEGPDGPRQICVADVPKRFDPYRVQNDRQPLKTIEPPAHGAMDPPNRSRIDIAVVSFRAEPFLITRTSDLSMKVGYRRIGDLAPTAAAFGISAAVVPEAEDRIAEFRWSEGDMPGGRWRVESDAKAPPAPVAKTDVPAAKR